MAKKLKNEEQNIRKSEDTCKRIAHIHRALLNLSSRARKASEMDNRTKEQFDGVCCD